MIEDIKRIPTEEAENCDIVVCMTVERARIIAPDSHQENCFVCKALIWVAPSSPKKPPKFCLQCACDRIEKREH